MSSQPWRGSAFGIELEGTFLAPGLDDERGVRGSGRRAALRLEPAAELAPGGSEILFEQPLPGG